MKALVKILVKVGSTDRKQTIALTFLLDNIYIRFGSGLCGRVVGVLMGAGCAPLVAGLFLFCYVCVGGTSCCPFRGVVGLMLLRLSVLLLDIWMTY